MRGSLKEVPFADVVQLMVMGKKTGRLSVTNGEDFLELYFKGGVVIYGKMVNRSEKIGEVLLSKGIIDEEKLKQAKILVEKGKPNLGSALLELGVPEEEIKKAYEEEVKKFVSSAILWDDGYFNFEPDEFPRERPLISIDPSLLLLESARAFDEWKKIQEIVPSLNDVCILKDSTYIPQDEKERKILELVDGKRTVKDIFEHSGENLFDIAETFRGLIFKGVIETKEKKEEEEEVSKAKILEHINLGYAFLKTGLYEEAEREFRRLHELVPDSAEGYFYLGLLSIYKKDFEKAAGFLKGALKRDPDNPKILNNLLYIYIETDRLDLAEEIIKKLEEAGFEDERFILNKAIFYEKKGDREKFENIIKDLMKDKSFLKTPYILLAQKFYNERKYLQVIEILSILKGYDKENPEVNYGLGISYRAIKRYKEAEDFLRQATRLAPSNVKYKLALGDLLYEKGRYDECKNIYTQVLSIDSKNKEALFRLGNIYLREGKYEDALRYFEELLKIEPENQKAKRNVEIIKKTLNV